MTSVYGPAASHERRVKGLEQPGEDIARSASPAGATSRSERSALVANLQGGQKGTERLHYGV